VVLSEGEEEEEEEWSSSGGAFSDEDECGSVRSALNYINLFLIHAKT